MRYHTEELLENLQQRSLSTTWTSSFSDIEFEDENLSDDELDSGLRYPKAF